jgi:SAM-dependent methyltransferase
MDQLIQENEYTREGPPGEQGRDVASTLLEAWLAPLNGRRILVIGGEHEPTSAGAADYLPQIDQYDSLSSPENFEQSNELPFESDQFDLVVCAFISGSSDVDSKAMDEIGRVLKRGGKLLIIDHLVPGSRLHGKKARKLRAAGEYVNSWMRLRNPLHKRLLDQDAWEQILFDGQWEIEQMATHDQAVEFGTWVDHYTPADKNRLRLRAMLIQAPEKVYAFLTPLVSGDRIAFRMIEVFILATKNAD